MNGNQRACIAESRMRCGRKAFVALALMLACTRPVMAIETSLGEVLGFLHQAGLIDQAIVEAEPMIQCLIDGGAVEKCAEEAGAQAKGLVPNDPKIQKVVAVFHAIKAQDWLQVFVLGGEQLVCTVLASSGGAIKDLFCSAIFDVAEPVITAAYGAVKDGDLLELVSLLGVEYACSLVDDAPGADELCSVLGEIVAGVAAGVKDAVGALGNIAEDVAGQSQHMPVEQYYITQWRNWLHYAVVKQLRSGTPAYLYAGMYGGTSCVDYFDSHKMSKSNAGKVCGIMKQRFVVEVSEAAKVFAQFPASYFAGAVAPRVPGWAAAYYENIKPSPPVSGDVPGHWLKTFVPKAPEPFRQLLMHCLGQTPLPLPPIPGPNDGVHAADKENLGIAQGWACTRVYGLMNTALQKQKAVVAGVSGKIAALGCAKLTPVPALHYACPTYATYRQCTALYPNGESEKESLCWVNMAKADPALAQQVASELGAKRCTTIDKKGYQDIKLVQCTRPWKQAKCKSLVATYSEGAPKPSTVACVARVDGGFVAGKAKVKSILKSVNTKSAGGQIDPGSGVSRGTAVLTGANCRTSQETVWDPLRITCEDTQARKEVAAQISQCVADPQLHGSDNPCHDFPLTMDSPAPPPVVAPVAPVIPVDVRLVDVQFQYFSRDGRSWASAATPAIGSMVAMRCTYAYAPETPSRLEWSIAFVEGSGNRLDRAVGPGLIDRKAGRVTRTWYGRLLAPGPVELGCIADPDGELKEPNESDNRLLRNIDVPGGQRVATARPRTTPRVARATTRQAAEIRGALPPLDLRFAGFAGIKSASTSGGVRNAPPTQTGYAGEPLMVDCSYVVSMDAINGEPIDIGAWRARIESGGQTLREVAGDTSLVSSHGASTPGALQYRWTPGKAGDQAFRCRLDVDSTIGETDESNNTRDFTVKILPSRRVRS